MRLSRTPHRYRESLDFIVISAQHPTQESFDRTFSKVRAIKPRRLVARRNERNSPPGVSLLIYASARPVDDEAEVEIGKNKEYRKRATRSRPRRLCF